MGKKIRCPLCGPLVPFGSEVSYKSAVADPNSSHRNELGTSSRQGIMVGYFLNRGGASSKDYLVFDLDTIQQNKDAQGIRVRQYGDVFEKRSASIPN